MVQLLLELGHLRHEVGQKGLGAEGVARDFLDQFFGVDRPTERPDGLAEPGLEPVLISAGYQGLDLTIFLLKSLRKLGANKVSKGIRGEITHESFCPMDILKAPLGVSLGLDSQQVLHPLVPLLR